jgi:hypothetical protein
MDAISFHGMCSKKVPEIHGVEHPIAEGEERSVRLDVRGEPKVNVETPIT